MLLAALPAAAQHNSPTLSVDTAGGYRASLRLSGLFGDKELQEVVESGLPLRVRIRIELWRDGWVDDARGSEIWNALLTFNPLEKTYRLRTHGSPSIDRHLSDFQNARSALEARRTFSLRPSEAGRYYFTANIEIETLSLSDLEELERWLQGELRPVVSGGGSVTGALGAGAKRLLVRILSLPTRTLDLKTSRFRVNHGK
jgi:uncharacterized protein DUF4390